MKSSASKSEPCLKHRVFLKIILQPPQFLKPNFEDVTWNLIEITAPHISSPTMNCSPKIAKIYIKEQNTIN